MRLALYGGIGSPRGDYSGKEQQEIPDPIVIYEGGDDVPRHERKREAESALDHALERAASEALDKAAEGPEIAAVSEQVYKQAKEKPPTPEQAAQIGMPLDVAAELATLARIDAAIKDRNEQFRDEQDAILALLLAA